MVGGTDRDEVEQLFHRCYGELVGLAGLILGGDRAAAEDVVQDVFAALYRRTEPLDDPTAVVGYLRRSVVNGARSRLRRRGVERRPHLRVAGSEPAPATDDAVVADDDARAVGAAVAQLPRRQRECIACTYELGLTNTQTAVVLGISAGSVKTHLHRATARLAILLEDRR